MEFEGFPPPERRLRLGLAGGGQGLIGKVHANGARLSGRWDVVAGALSSYPERARASGREWLFEPDRVYTDYREMARAEAARPDGIDAVAVVTPNHLHAPVAMAFMEAGIDVITDKPLTSTMDELDPLIAAHRQSGVIFGVTYAYASHAMVRQAREMVRAGELGEIRQVHVEYLQDWAMDVTDQGDETPWRLDRARNGPSFAVADIGTHAEHLTSFVTGLEIEALRADFHVTGAPKSMEDSAFMQLRLTGGIPGTMIISQAMAGAQCGLRLRIGGTKASIDWLQETPEFIRLRPIDGPERIISRGHGGGVYPAVERLLRMPRGHPEALSDAWANLYLELGVAVEARRSGRSIADGLLAYPGIEEGVRGMRFVEAALASARSGNWTDLRN